MQLRNTRIKWLPAFVIAAVVAWGFFYLTGDYNSYVGDVYRDGRAWVKARATPLDRVLWSFGFALLFAAINTTALWLWARPRRQEKDNVDA